MVALSACSGTDSIKLDKTGNVHDAIEAATGPLDDLNIKRRDIPEPLQKIASNPYARPLKTTCGGLREEITELDNVLGPDVASGGLNLASAEGIMDIKRMSMPSGEDVMNGAGNLVHDTVMTTIRAQTNILPLRSILRKVSGADRHQKKVEQAYEIGKLRRAYLKGFAQDHYGTHCLDVPATVEAKAEIPPPTATGGSEGTIEK